MTTAKLTVMTSGAELYAAPFTFRQARESGLSASAIRARVGAGRWLRLGRGLFVDRELWLDADEPARHLLLARRALEVAPKDAVLSHTTAALVHGLQFLEPWTPQLPTLTATLPRSTRFNRNQRYWLYRAELPSQHVSEGELPVTSVARTVVDLARSSPLDAGVVLADSALRQELCTQNDLIEVYRRCETWPGAIRAGRAVFFADPVCESPLESVVRVAFHEQGLPPPRTQVPLEIGAVEYRLDFLWEEHKTVAEADGMFKYTEPDVLRDEKLREDRLRDLGLEVVRITWQAVRDDPAGVAARVRAAFERARLRS